MTYQLGGSSNLWAGRLGIIDKFDFYNKDKKWEMPFENYEEYLKYCNIILSKYFDIDFNNFIDSEKFSNDFDIHKTIWNIPPLNLKKFTISGLKIKD